MNRILPSIASVLLLAGVAAPAFAQDVVVVPPYDDAMQSYADAVSYSGDLDGDGIPNADDPVDDRYDTDGNWVYFEVGDQLPADADAATVVNYNLFGLRAPPVGLSWNRMGDNFYLIDGSGRIIDAVYNLHD